MRLLGPQNVSFTALMCAVFGLLTGAAQGKVGTITLKELTESAAAIAVVKVENVAALEGIKVAEATVLRPLKGLRAGQRIAFIAQPTWTCDTSRAVQGETILLFLAKPSFWPAFEGMLSASQLSRITAIERRRGVPFCQIAHSGRGRIPILSREGQAGIVVQQERDSRRPTKTVLTLQDVLLPPDLPSRPLPGTSSSERLVSLADMERRLMRWIHTPSAVARRD